jgi:hypothetical protein
MSTLTPEVKSYKDLIAWRRAISLVTEIYRITVQFPRHGRATPGEFAQFLSQARGSLCEVETQILIAHELAYIDRQQNLSLNKSMDELGRILNGLINSIQRRRSRRPTSP